MIQRLLREHWVVALLLVLAVVSTILFFTIQPVRDFLTSPTALRDYVESLGLLGPVVIVGYHALQVVFALLPGLAVDISNGYVFGIGGGLVVSYLGIGLGTLAAVLLSRKFGRPLVDAVAKSSGQKNIDKYLGQRSLWFFFIFFLIPGMPHDVLSYVVGLTKAPLWKIMLTALVGRTPTIVGAVMLGATGSNLSPLAVILIALGLFVVISPVLIRAVRLRSARPDITE